MDRSGCELPLAVDAYRYCVDQRAGPMSYYQAGEGRPLLLLHSINAAASAYEMRPLFVALRDRFHVTMPDLPGFGFSDRSRRSYAPRLYTDAVLDMLDVIKHQHGTTPVDVVALSLAGEFASRAVTENSERFRSLALITPTGFSRGSEKLREPDTTREIVWLSSILEARLWRRGLFRLLTKPSVVRYFLRRTYGSEDIDQAMADYDVCTARQPGAEHAPLAFLSGRLFSKDIRLIYEALDLPIWVAYATKGDFKDFSAADDFRGKPRWRFDAFDTGALVHFEKTDEFLAGYMRFVEEAA